jgi:hypothetical protein
VEDNDVRQATTMKLTDSPKTMGEVMKPSPEQLLFWQQQARPSFSGAEKRVYDRIGSRLRKLNNDKRGRKALRHFQNETAFSRKSARSPDLPDAGGVEEALKAGGNTVSNAPTTPLRYEH